MIDILVLAFVLLLAGLAAAHLLKEKKKGVRCIGCPMAGTCAKKNNSSSCH